MQAKYDYIPKGYKVGKDGLLYHSETGEVYSTRKTAQTPTLPGTPVVDNAPSEPKKRGGKKII